MADVYATIADADYAVQERLAEVLERRSADVQQREMLSAYLADIDFSDAPIVLDIGCGTGSVSRELARRLPAGRVTGIDPSPVFLTAARRHGAKYANLEFIEGDGRTLPYGDESFDAAFFHTTLSHVPCPESALQEAFRVLRPGGTLAVFDGNYTTTTLANGEFDPLQACADAAMAALVHDRWLIQRLPGLIREAGFTIVTQRSHGIVEACEPDYMFTIADRGADVLAADGRIGVALAQALKDEARRRVTAGCFFGSIAYGSLVARKQEFMI
ncbi:MAG: methyltransferase domain-containing protein [Desulfuromonadaceae bacterium]|nr:methyltransferase domain-containing protein [Desulfuromonadaceae bacterium]MDD5105186.1 methyltransferase domain-containing protein [Desulfuromonadaceae bacterium]